MEINLRRETQTSRSCFPRRRLFQRICRLLFSRQQFLYHRKIDDGNSINKEIVRHRCPAKSIYKGFLYVFLFVPKLIVSRLASFFAFINFSQIFVNY